MEDETKQETQAAETEPTAEQPTAEDTGATAPATDATDWKAQARKWQARAKANKEKADRWDEYESNGNAELQRAKDELETARREVSELRESAERSKTLLDVSQETGVPAALLKGETADELRESAKAISAFAASRQTRYPQDKGGAGGNGSQVTVASIEAIKDPVARVRARAQHQELYK